MERRTTSKATLLRLGFAEPEQAEVALAALGPAREPLLAIFGLIADPDLALAALIRLVEAAPDAEELLTTLADDEGTAMRLMSLLGASAALGEHLARHPDHWHELTDPTLGSVRPPAYLLRERLIGAVTGKERTEAVAALRIEYRRLLLRLAARDLGHDLLFEDAAAELSDLACSVLEAGLTIARAVVPEADQVRLAVIAMGKTGGHELNYISDVDVMFVHEPVEDADPTVATRAAYALAAELIKVCGEHTGEGNIWEVDAALRPEGKAGALSRTLAAMTAYYDRWASTWEFQALLKARPAAGDLALGRAFIEAVQPFVWSAAERDRFVEDTQAMRRRVVEHIPSKDAERELKLGSGGLRDVEFAVQLLQLVHGRADDTLREPTTLSALAALTRGGYVGREDGETLHAAYTFLRTVEHRIQLFALRRTHLLPTDEPSLRRLGRSLGYLRDPISRLETELGRQRREIRRLHEKLFYRPLLAAVAALPGSEAHLSLEAAGTQLRALGYADPAAALRHLTALTQGVSRTADIQRQLLPVLLQWFADGPDPDAGLFGFRRISEALGSTPWYLRTLRDEGLVAERLARVLSTSRYVTNLLEREPEGVRLLGETLEPRTAAALTDEMLAAGRRRTGVEDAARSIRAVRRRELFRLAAGDVDGALDVTAVGTGLTRLTDATLSSTLQVISDAVLAGEPAPAELAVIAMGRYGGAELSYASDADVLFVHRGVDGADPGAVSTYAMKVFTELRRLLAAAGPDPALELDADLRPEGRSGPLVRSLTSYAAYYAKWTDPWEIQALLRADAAVGSEALRADFTALIDPMRYPVGGLDDDAVREIRRIKGRVDTERMPRGADPTTHLKLGRGALADIEWTVQLLQLRHAHEVEGLRTPQTLPAIRAAHDAGLIESEDAEILIEAWLMVSRIRNAITLARGRAADQLPTDPREMRAVATLMGYPDGTTNELTNDHLRLTRLASGVVDRVFWEQ
ncbi:bifunctional [glutamine synthetase] adenylyltransferase/[glutamine synthetase]-adenylyl-L-tyrosine phosphorylase [Nocardioides sp.]|uniref:bifunctional [glutamine synthetase] adenylyltransferase/[glutamine synthetase]-adenylyl-L-tyrosine phosphorylase n=1 Tax=Nocardioides sp. TaxID=35761 RepID=UPI002610786A|nr:bifunctional [glutamine synthetase] adenylyltransferase/[glutamine synthetase]-adenylyl-L-tyrosine phosphorylase [Nocardioides sp.]